jgi:hypothetical protein
MAACAQQTRIAASMRLATGCTVHSVQVLMDVAGNHGETLWADTSCLMLTLYVFSWNVSNSSRDHIVFCLRLPSKA